MCCLWFDSIDSDAVVETSAYMWDWCVYLRWRKKNGSSCSDGSATCSGLTVIGEEKKVQLHSYNLEKLAESE